MQKRITKPELERIIRSMLPSTESAKFAKMELAELRANFAELIYNISEPIERTRKEKV